MLELNPEHTGGLPLSGTKATAGSKAKWKTRGTFNCLTGRWTGIPFDIDPELVAHVTEYAATQDGNAIMRHQVRADQEQHRVIVSMSLPA